MNQVTNIGTNALEGFIEDLSLVRVPPWWQSPWFIVALLIAIAFGVWLGRKLVVKWRRQPQAPTPVHAVPGEPPHLLALERLQQLRRNVANISPYEFCIECSQILREYIGARFAVAILFQTTREFLVAAQASPVLQPDHREKLGVYLHFCDRVKFGRFGMTREEMLQMLDYAESFVKGTAAPAERATAGGVQA